MTEQDSKRLMCATAFEILPTFYPAYGQVAGGITIQRRPQKTGADKWAIYLRGSWALSLTGDWEWESIPSERTPEFIASCRFATLDEAWEAALEAAAEEVQAARDVAGIAKQPLPAEIQRAEAALFSAREAL